MERWRDNGFTLVEMIIALVLATIVIGVAVAGVMGAVSSSASSRANSVSSAMLENASQLLASDASRAETVDRRAGLVRDPDDLRIAVQGGSNPQSTHPTENGTGPGGTADIDDVVLATPDVFQIRADVDDDGAGNVECVTWTNGATTKKTFVLERIVSTNCGGGVISRTTVLEAPRTVPDLVIAPFTYELQCDKSECGPDSKAKKQPCATWIEDSAVTGKQKRWIVGVRATFVGASQQSSGIARSGSQVAMTIRSRDTTEWRGALGC